MTPDDQHTEDYWTITAMASEGGSFVKALAQATRCADMQNRARIKQAWPELWEEYRRRGHVLMLESLEST